MRALVLVACVACSDKAAVPAAALVPPRTGSGSAATEHPTLLAGHKQLVTAVVDDWTSTRATLQFWQRDGAAWKKVGEPWPAVIGRGGSAWGIGVHGVGAPGRDGPVKKEGDLKSPAGAFLVRGAYGVAAEPPPRSKLPYESTARGDFECIDDAASEHYGQIVDRKQVPADWQSSETLLRDDALYNWIVDLGHNPEHTPGKGSCIFWHVWAGADDTTVGCTAMEEGRLVALISALDPESKPIFVLLPRNEYTGLAVGWGLPPL